MASAIFVEHGYGCEPRSRATDHVGHEPGAGVACTDHDDAKPGPMTSRR